MAVHLLTLEDFAGTGTAEEAAAAFADYEADQRCTYAREDYYETHPNAIWFDECEYLEQRHWGPAEDLRDGRCPYLCKKLAQGWLKNARLLLRPKKADRRMFPEDFYFLTRALMAAMDVVGIECSDVWLFYTTSMTFAKAEDSEGHGYASTMPAAKAEQALRQVDGALLRLDSAIELRQIAYSFSLGMQRFDEAGTPEATAQADDKEPFDKMVAELKGKWSEDTEARCILEIVLSYRRDFTREDVSRDLTTHKGFSMGKVLAKLEHRFKILGSRKRPRRNEKKRYFVARPGN